LGGAAGRSGGPVGALWQDRAHASRPVAPLVRPVVDALTSMAVRERISAAQARRVVLAAQGFNDPAPAGRPDRRALRRVLARTGLFQIDSVNVLARAHYLPLFSRLGPYPVALLDRAAYGRPRELFEYWGHEASLLPLDAHRLLRWRMAEAEQRAWGGMREIASQRPDFLADVLAEVAARGPVSAGDVEGAAGVRPRRAGPWWDWSHVKMALEYLFWSGAVTTASRRGFERVYDLPDRVLPAEVLAAPAASRSDAHRELVLRAARSCGVATEADLRDYYRLDVADTAQAVTDLTDSGQLLRVAVEGWRQPGYLYPAAAFPRDVRARALLAPFDPLVWGRDRTERLFGFRYRLEIYVPAQRRVHGYYVLPFLLGDTLVARVDLKADRQRGALLVQSAHAEPGAPADTADQLVGELSAMADWLGLEHTWSTGVGDLPLPALPVVPAADAG
jgi:uncharacterized protein